MTASECTIMHESQQDVLAARAFGMNALHAPQGACSAALAQLESLVGLQLTPTAEAPLSMVFRCGGRHGDGAIAVDGWGDGDNPESPIVFFHGGGQTRRSWDRNARPTQARVHAHKHTRTTKTLCDAVDSSGSCALHACLRAACLYRCSRLAVGHRRSLGMRLLRSCRSAHDISRHGRRAPSSCVLPSLPTVLSAMPRVLRSVGAARMCECECGASKCIAPVLKEGRLV